MTLQEIADFVCTKTGYTDAKSIEACKKFLRARYQMVWDSALWRETLSLMTLGTQQNGETIADTSVLILTEAGAEVIGVRKSAGTNSLGYIPTAEIFRLDPALFDRSSDDAVGWTSLPASPVGPGLHGSNGGGTGGMIFYSDSADDIVQAVSVVGENGSGIVFRETITLQGETPVPTTKFYSHVSSIGLNAVCKGTVYVMDNVGESGDTILARISPGYQSSPLFTRIKILETPIAGTLYEVLYKRRCLGLLQDGDSPAIRNIDNALIAYAQGDMLERARQYNKAKDKFAEGEAMRALTVQIEKGQAENSARIIPQMDGEHLSFASMMGL